MVRQALLAADRMLDGSADKVLVPALERAFAADPVSEDLARSLMRALVRQGQNSEAVRVHRQLRQMLSLLLGVAPPEKQTIFVTRPMRPSQRVHQVSSPPRLTTVERSCNGNKARKKQPNAEQLQRRLKKLRRKVAHGRRRMSAYAISSKQL